jgi:hypothetical protein
MRKVHFAGLALWRGGVILVVGYLAYQILRAVLSFTDPQLELAVGLLLTGVFLVFVSVVAEQVRDARSERSKGE